jgi:GNAT superfamily N-acetyltransferase
MPLLFLSLLNEEVSLDQLDAQTTQVTPAVARRAWRIMEPYHAMTFFAPEARGAFKELGLKGYWMGYFASRSAPLGAVSASVVTALFYNFQPAMVQRALPDAWRFATPDNVLRMRYQSADIALRRLLGDRISSPEVAAAASIARQATEGCSIIGRALFASYTDIPWPEAPHLALWHAATLLREFRGDGHIAALLAENIDGCEAHLLQVASGSVSREATQPNRGWTDEEWEAAAHRLQTRGLLDAQHQLTVQGKSLYQSIEERTDRLALPPWQHLGIEQVERLLTLVEPLSKTIFEQGGIPASNPLGMSLKTKG